MAVNLIWDSEKHTIVRVEFDGELSSDDLRACLHEIDQMIRLEDERVDILFDTASARQIPRNILTLIGGFIREAPLNLGILVLIGKDTYIGSLIITFWRLYPFEATRVHLATDLEHGYTVIANSRQAEV